MYRMRPIDSFDELDARQPHGNHKVVVVRSTAQIRSQNQVGYSVDARQFRQSGDGGVDRRLVQCLVPLADCYMLNQLCSSNVCAVCWRPGLGLPNFSQKMNGDSKKGT